MKKLKRKLSSSRLIIIAAVLLAAYLVSILAVTNFGQTRLKESQQRELNLKVQSYTNMLENFFNVTNDELTDLANDKSMLTYFANLASGMSMQYGLGASLFNLNRELNRLIDNTEISQQSVYQRLVLVGYDGTVIADTEKNPDTAFDRVNMPHIREQSLTIRVVQNDKCPYIQLVKRVEYAGKPVAFLVADLNRKVIVSQLTAQEHVDSRSRMDLITADGDIFIWDSLTTEPQSDDKNVLANKIYFEMEIENTPFKLRSWFEPVNEKDIFTSGWFIAGLSFLAVPVVFGLFYTFMINNANVILRTKFEESHKQRRILSTQNQLLIEEIEKRKASEQELAYQATHDALTGLPNRNCGNDRLEQELVRAKRSNTNVLVMFIDLDNFKQINDTLGHSAGDQVLMQSTARLLDSIRDTDVLARLGGDEFLLVIPELNNLDSATYLAARVLSLFDDPFIWKNQELFISTSIGMSVYPQDGNNVQQLLASADTAMYRAKQDGRNAFSFYNAAMSADLQRTLDLDGRLRQALARDELEIYYQPIIELASNQIIGAEALMRWHDTEFGFISPDEFIPLAEKNGLIHLLGEFAINKACMQAAEWQKITPLHIAINFSSVQFRHCDKLFEKINAGLMQSGLPADKLDIEITESLLFNHNDEVVSLLNKLQAMGMQLSIDDFGTGYSALSYLQKFPFDKLKIDRAFLQNMHESDSDRELVNAIIAMAKALNLKVVAEGIEDQWHADYLRSMHCEYGQGYFYSKPVPAKEFEALLHQQKEDSV
ncbi:Sensory box/GGDEF family protein ScrC (involved in swarmer cell regulation) [Moritella sp. JT01]|uniref:putative bifunctional diguanylate cyclase/phosphodiesterase n=1 Tax=Moritella sp. JT01 TaxID=756698 RepID=UPI000799E391|nr:EAL domain-containing protein [Moritella sp. JT01]KXO07376.1 Sensory box/GGDEF family protein ScrC (involved in swarmer cell regulation) [Moritella sp. JT01]